MSEVSIRVQVDDGPEQVLHPADTIGRGPQATLRVSNPAVSEVHAHLSLNTSGELWLKAVAPMQAFGHWLERQRVAVGDFRLTPEGPTLRVLEVRLPQRLLGLAVEGPGGTRTLGALQGHKYHSVVLQPEPTLLRSYDPDATWKIRVLEGVAALEHQGSWVPLRAGMRWRSAGWALVVLDMPIGTAGVQWTRDAAASALRAELGVGRVRLIRGGDSCLIEGTGATLLLELVRSPHPIHREELVAKVFSHYADPHVSLRRCRSRLRQALKSQGFDEDLILACDADGHPQRPQVATHWWVGPALRGVADPSR